MRITKQWRRAGITASAGAVATVVLVGIAQAPLASEVAQPGVGDDLAVQAVDVSPRPSVSQKPAVVAKSVGARERATVTWATVTDEGFSVAEQKVRGREAARKAIRQAQGTENVVAVEVDRFEQLISPIEGTAGQSANGTSNDPRRSELWALDTLEAEAAWEHSTGEGVVVAVVDTGVDASHEDLNGRVIPGASFVDPTTDGTVDGGGHGTHVAGTIVANANNGIGIAGVAPGAKVLPVQVLNHEGWGYTSDVAAGLAWAADNGAHIINMSLGSSKPSELMEAVVDYASGRGALLIASAGNAGTWGPAYPAMYPGVVAVSAVDWWGWKTMFSNFGDHIGFAAPGENILSTVPGTDGYRWADGTSMASPHVAGVAALVMAATDTGLLDSPTVLSAMRDAAVMVEQHRPGVIEYEFDPEGRRTTSCLFSPIDPAYEECHRWRDRIYLGNGIVHAHAAVCTVTDCREPGDPQPSTTPDPTPTATDPGTPDPTPTHTADPDPTPTSDPDPTPTDPGTPSPDPSSPDPTPTAPSNPVKAHVVETSNWGSGYCASVTVTTTSAQPVVWSVTIPKSKPITTVWSAEWSQTATELRASGASWNRTITAAQPASFGFCAGN